LALFGKNLSSPPQIDVERRRHCFAPALSLPTLQLVHRAIELPVQVTVVAQEFVGCICGRQSEAPSFRVYCEILGLCHESFKLAKPFQLLIK
jgi:hypothetical protein